MIAVIAARVVAGDRSTVTGVAPLFDGALACSFTLTHSLSLDLDDRWGTTVDVADSWVHRCRSLVSLMVSTGPSPVHLVMSSSHLLLCPPRLLVPSTVPCSMVFDSPVDLITWPYHLSLRFLTMDRSSSYGPMTSCIILRTLSFVTRSR